MCGESRSGGIALQRLFSTFPGRWPGLGLLLLRAAVGLTYIIQAADHLLLANNSTFAFWLINTTAIAIGASLLIGLLTPIVSVGAALISIGFISQAVLTIPASPLNSRLGAVDTVAVTIAIMLLGPGAFSVDAYLFGRREIIIPDAPHYKKH